MQTWVAPELRLWNWEQMRIHIIYWVQVPAYNAHLRSAALEEPVSPGRRLDARALVHQVAKNPCAVCIV